MKNSKFGFGGKKDKRNNADSHFGGPKNNKRPGSAKKGFFILFDLLIETAAINIKA